MKQTKKLIAALLVLLLTFAAAPAAFAASDVVIATGNGGEGIAWTLTEDGVLTVTGSGPIVDETETEYDDEGVACVSKLDCIGWQLYRLFEEKTKGFSAEQQSRALFDFVKEIVVEEGITEIPDGEFSDFFPRHISLPASLATIGSSIVDARFAETLTINNKDAEINGNITISGYQKDAQPFASLDEAIEAKIAMEAEFSRINELQSILYDGGAAYLLKLGLYEDVTEDDFMAAVNEYYGIEMESLDAFLAYCLEQTNLHFSTNYDSADKMYTVITDEDGTRAEYDPALEEQLSDLYEAADLEGRLDDMALGAQDDEDMIAYQWLTVRGPSGGGAEKAAKASGVPFEATASPDGPGASLFGRIKAAYEMIRTLVIRIINWIRFHLAVLKK